MRRKYTRLDHHVHERIDPHISADAAERVVQLGHRARRGSQGHLPHAGSILSEQGYRLAKSNLRGTLISERVQPLSSFRADPVAPTTR